MLYTAAILLLKILLMSVGVLIIGIWLMWLGFSVVHNWQGGNDEKAVRGR